MSRKPELSAAYARLVLQSAIAPAAQLLHGVTLTARDIADADFIEVADLGPIFRNYDRLANDSAWTAKLGAQFNIGAHGPLGFAALSAPTLGAALDVMANLSGSRSSAMALDTFATGKHYLLRMQDRTGEADFSRWLAEVLAKIIESLLATILGHPVGENVRISFAHAAPEPADSLLGQYDASVVFGAGATTIAVPLAWRRLPSPLYDEPVYRANVIKCRELIASRESAESAAGAVRNRLRNHFDAQVLARTDRPPPTLEQLADEMHTTPRTLIRRLHKEQTTYRQILEALRQEYATGLLQDARMTVADVAALLGYREPANFGRAFLRWYGASPAAWRRGGSRGGSAPTGGASRGQ
jgi:AraC-like DNA-binding protein